MSFPYTSWIGREGRPRSGVVPCSYELRGEILHAAIAARDLASQIAISIEKDELIIEGTIDGEWTTIYRGPFPITKAALTDAFAKLIEDSLKEDT